MGGIMRVCLLEVDGVFSIYLCVILIRYAIGSVQDEAGHCPFTQPWPQTIPCLAEPDISDEEVTSANSTRYQTQTTQQQPPSLTQPDNS
jgi:hypothetical protein